MQFTTDIYHFYLINSFEENSGIKRPDDEETHRA
jgi:hypothetical protein